MNNAAPMRGGLTQLRRGGVSFIRAVPDHACADGLQLLSICTAGKLA